MAISDSDAVSLATIIAGASAAPLDAHSLFGRFTASRPFSPSHSHPPPPDADSCPPLSCSIRDLGSTHNQTALTFYDSTETREWDKVPSSYHTGLEGPVEPSHGLCPATSLAAMCQHVPSSSCFLSTPANCREAFCTALSARLTTAYVGGARCCSSRPEAMLIAHHFA